MINMARTKTKKLKYIGGDPRYGLVYDFDKINKIYNSLGCPPDVYNPTTAPLDEAQYFVLMSERESGKTTNWILYGMIMNWEYGTTVQYVRQTEDDIAPKNSSDIFSTILDYDYIEKITHGEYNNVFYKSRRWYLCKVDDSGKITKLAEDHFMFMCSVQKQERLKSSYNAPTGDLLIFDEFVSKYYFPDEFIDLCNLTKTIFRGRRSPKIIMLANTIDRHSPYFNELEIYDEIQTLPIGEHQTIETPLGTRVYLELIGATKQRQQKRSIINRLFYGFHNPKLAAITGADWSMRNYQHIPRTDPDSDVTVTTLTNKIYIYYNRKYIRLEIVLHSELGLCMFVHWATKTYADSIICTTEERLDPRYHNKYGNGTLPRFIEKMLKENRVYYQTNDIGSFFESYYNFCTKKGLF